MNCASNDNGNDISFVFKVSFDQLYVYMKQTRQRCTLINNLHYLIALWYKMKLHMEWRPRADSEWKFYQLILCGIWEHP